MKTVIIKVETTTTREIELDIESTDNIAQQAFDYFAKHYDWRDNDIVDEHSDLYAVEDMDTGEVLWHESSLGQ